MKRRSFLAMLGIAPVVGVVVAKALSEVPKTYNVTVRENEPFRFTDGGLRIETTGNITRYVFEADKFVIRT